MGSSLNFNALAGFKAVHGWQQNLIRNAQGLLQPGFNRINTHLGPTPGGPAGGGRAPTRGSGGSGASGGTADTLMLSGTSLEFAQGDINPAQNETALAIQGQGFFIVAENLRPGAKLFLTRAGDFSYDAQGRLVNKQGLFVVGGGGTLTDPPTPMIDRRGDGTVTLPDLTLARVGARNALAMSAYGPTTYEVTAASGQIQAFANGSREVGFVQTHSLEFAQSVGLSTELQVESTEAAQTYKLFKDLLDNYNRATDDVLGLIR